MYKLKSVATVKPSKGENIPSDSPFEPGLGVNVRDVIIAYTQGGQVQNLNLKRPVYDDESLVDGDDVQATVFDGHDVDLTDVYDSAEYLTSISLQQKEIQRLAVEYSTGKISFDEFCSKANQQNPDLARPYVERFGQNLSTASADVG